MALRTRTFVTALPIVVAASLLGGCSKNSDTPADMADLGADQDGGADAGLTCKWKDVPATAGAGGTVQAGALSAGAAEVMLDLPVGSALGGFTARSIALGGVGFVDDRTSEISAKFYPSVGIETIPKAKALALSAGGEKVVLIRIDTIMSDNALSFDVAERLGAEYNGKVMVAGTHTHSGPADYSTNTVMAVGLSRYRSGNYKKLVDRCVEAAQAAIAASRPAKLGIAHDANFDPKDDVNRDRRGDNDVLAGGSKKDHDLFVLRVDGTDGKPIAVVDVVGIHGTVLDADNQLMATDAPGSIERAVEEAFDSKVIAMHLQGAAGDVSPAGHGGVDIIPNDVAHYNFARAESVGRFARPFIMAAWADAGSVMKDQLAMEMLTRVIPEGPDASTFSVRGGALSYKPFDISRMPDGQIFAADGKTVLSPIDEFNAPFGAGLCGGTGGAIFEDSPMPGVSKLLPYKSCMLVDVAMPVLGRLVDSPVEPAPFCASTRTTVSALRLGEYVVAMLPGEPLTLLVDHLRSLSPIAPEKTIVVGYAQGHVGYLLTAEDWLQGGYEPSINLWGPLEGEHIAESAADLLKLAVTDAREDGTKGGMTQRQVAWSDPDPIPPPDPAPKAGTVPDTVPLEVYFRGVVHPATAQPEATVPRIGSARFVWIGEDPQSGTPRVTLQRQDNGTWLDVTRRSGRSVHDGDLLLTWTPTPLKRRNGMPVRTHYWAVEFQAVTPSGTAQLDELEDRMGLPLGSYRFHVSGTGYALDSSAFQVTTAPLTVAATISGTQAQLDVSYDAKMGFRLLDYQVPSDGNVPARRGPFNVELELVSGGTSKVQDVMPTAAGQLTVDVPTGETVKKVTVTDRFGNKGEATP